MQTLGSRVFTVGRRLLSDREPEALLLTLRKDKTMEYNFLYAALTGVGAAAVIKLIDNVVQWKLQRKAAKEDRTVEDGQAEIKKIKQWEKDMEDKVNALVNADKYIMFDRIRYLGQKYVAEKEVDFDDRRILNQMHDVYHNELGGNGDLKELMDAVNALTLKKAG